MATAIAAYVRSATRLGSLILLIILTSAARDASACSCVMGMPICETFWRTPVVFSGEVVEITPAPPARDLRFPAKKLVRFRVDRVWRGEAAGEIEVHTGAGGGDCGYDFVRGGQYLVYAHYWEGRLSTGICSRTRPLSDAKEDLAYFETAFRPAGVGRIFGTAQFQRSSPDTPEQSAPGYTVILTGGGTTRRTTTAADGRYEFRGVPAGRYTVELITPQTQLAGGSRNTELADPRGCASVDFWIMSNGRVALRVLKPSGEPASNLTLDVVEFDSLVERDRFPHAQRMRTDADGFAETKGLRPTRYVIGINVTQAPDASQAYPRMFYPGVTDVAGARVLDLNYGERAELEPMILPEPLVPQAITGVVLWPDGSPAARASVSVSMDRATHGLSLQLGTAVSTDAQGRFTFRAYRGQTYRVSATVDVRGISEQWRAESKAFEVRSDVEPIALTLAPPRR